MRQDHMSKMADFTQDMQTAIHRVTSAISAHRKTGGRFIPSREGGGEMVQGREGERWR